VDSRALLKAVLERSFELPRADIERLIFPGSSDIAPVARV
jgi:uncharacterized protein (DUF1501 family)